VSYVDLSIPLNIVVGVDGYEESQFGESVHDHKKIESNLRAVKGKHTIQSMLMSSHFQSRILNGCNNPPGFT
jgi:hypothetical protein